MANCLFFDTTESAVEILWDVALAFFVVRLALLYAGLVFGSALSLAYFLRAHDYPLPAAAGGRASFSCVGARANLLPGLTVALSALWAAVLVRFCEVPRVFSFRLAVGATAAALVAVAEAVVGLVEYEVFGGVGMGGVMGGWMMGMGVMAMFAAMPVLLMGLGARKEAPEVAFGFGEKKGVRPTVEVSEKRREAGDL